MQLSSVRALKQELFAAPHEVFHAVRSTEVAAFSTRSAPARQQLAASAMQGIALGATRSKGGYRLAVRQQQAGPLVHFMTDEIRRRAKGEVDVAFVAGRKSPHYLALLTNNHVIADENGNRSGDPIVQQGTLDGGTRAANLIGELWKYKKLSTSGTNLIDAALGYVYDDIDVDEQTIGLLGKLAGVGDAPSDSCSPAAMSAGPTARDLPMPIR